MSNSFEKKTVVISKTIVVHHFGKCVDNERRAREGKKPKASFMSFGFFVKMVRYVLLIYNTYDFFVGFII